MGAKPKRGLDPAAVKAANEKLFAVHADDPQFWKDHPKGVLSGNDADAQLRGDWIAFYKIALEQQTALPKTPPAATQKCEKVPRATLQVKWSKPKVTPNHNNSWPPATPPTDTIPEEAKVQLIAETKNVPDGTTAAIVIMRCKTHTAIPDGVLANLLVRGGKVVDPKTGNSPEWVFEAKHDPWGLWDAPFFYFICSVDYQNLVEETPSDYKKKESACLRVKYWHKCIAADDPGSPLAGVLPECNAVFAMLNGVPESKSTSSKLATPEISVAKYGSLLRNTYVFHQASHGNALKRSDGSFMPDADPGETKYVKSQWRSVVHITPHPRFGDAQIKNKTLVPSVPRYLYYASCCLTGWESSFASNMVARGTRNVIAFRRTIPDGEAQIMAKTFYKRWAGTYKLNPIKIPECFLKAGRDHYPNMKPILYGAGGMAIIDPNIVKAAAAVSTVLGGPLGGLWGWLKGVK
jgi:hypothetical protein